MTGSKLIGKAATGAPQQVVHGMNVAQSPARGVLAVNPHMRIDESVASVDYTKKWQNEVPLPLRDHVCFKILQVLKPVEEKRSIHEKPLDTDVRCARKIEREAFKSAEDRSQYYLLVAENAFKVAKQRALLDGQLTAM